MARFNDLRAANEAPRPTGLASEAFTARLLGELESMDSSGDFDWASDFLQSVHDQVQTGKPCTQAQLDGINRIRAKRNGSGDHWPEIEVY